MIVTTNSSASTNRRAAPPRGRHGRGPSPSRHRRALSLRRLQNASLEVILRIIFAGTPAPAVPALTALLASSHEVVAVISRPDAPAGRGRREVSSPIAVLARDAGLPVLQPVSARDPRFRDELAAFEPDAAAVVAYGALLPRPLLDVPTRGWVNLHFSLLPAWRGAAPVQAAIRAGDPITGASTFALEEGMDTGPVYGTVTEAIRPDDTAGSLLDRLAGSGAMLLVATMDLIGAGTADPRPQPADGVSYAGKITVEQAQVRWSNPAVAVDRQIRSVTPEPGAWTDSPWGRLGLGPAQPVQLASPAPPDGEQPLAPGELRVGRRRVLVGTGTEPLLLGTVRAAGRRDMSAADWARGTRPAPGDTLGRAATGPDPASDVDHTASAGPGARS